MRLTVKILALLMFLNILPSYAQLGREELEGIERHRKERKKTEILQSIDELNDTSITNSIIINTWDFLEETEKTGEEKTTPEEKKQIIPVDIDLLTLRLLLLPKELTIPYRKELEAHVRSYIENHSKALQYILGKYDYYEDYLRYTFRRYGLPEDLSALSIVESAMNPLAVSKAGAVGMWQFMPDAARDYGLQCNAFIDERLDPLRSADAAARYLRDAYKKFGSWPLAISSYNCGAKAVESAIRKADSREFWDIYQYLPEETRSYMPAFVAALYSIYFSSLHEIKIKPFSEGKITSYKIENRLTYKQIINATGITQKELIRLNPQYKVGIIPGGEKTYILRLPSKYNKLFKDNIYVVNN